MHSVFSDRAKESLLSCFLCFVCVFVCVFAHLLVNREFWSDAIVRCACVLDDTLNDLAKNLCWKREGKVKVKAKHVIYKYTTVFSVSLSIFSQCVRFSGVVVVVVVYKARSFGAHQPNNNNNYRNNSKTVTLAERRSGEVEATQDETEHKSKTVSNRMLMWLYFRFVCSRFSSSIQHSLWVSLPRFRWHEFWDIVRLLVNKHNQPNEYRQVVRCVSIHIYAWHMFVIQDSD